MVDAAGDVAYGGEAEVEEEPSYTEDEQILIAPLLYRIHRQSCQITQTYNK